MSLTYQCDSCGAVISRDDLRRGNALVHQGQHYCGACKGPIVAFLKRSAAAGGPATTGGDTPAASASSPARPLPPAPQPPARPSPVRRKRPAAPGSAQERPARPATAGKARPARISKMAGAAKASEEPSRESGRKAGAGQRPSRPVGGSRLPRTAAGARPRAFGRRAAGAGAGQRRRRQVVGQADDHVVPGNRKVVLFAGIGAGVVAVLVVVVLVWKPGGEAPSLVGETAVVSVAGSMSPSGATGDAPNGAVGPAANAVDDEAAAAAAREGQQRGLVERFHFRFSELRGDPARLLDFQTELLIFQRTPGLFPNILEEVIVLSLRVEGRKNELSREVFADSVARSEALQDEGAYGEAHQVWESTPGIINQSVLLEKWQENEQRAARYAAAAQFWNKLAQKAKAYFKQGDPDIAKAILELNLPKSYEAEYEKVWAERTALLDQIRLGQAEQIAKLTALQKRARDAAEARRQAKLEKDRQEAWEKYLVLKEWVPLLSNNGDLENWYMTVDYRFDRDSNPFPWKNTADPDRPVRVLSADIGERKTPVHIGMNGNRWLDWVLEFDVQVLEGKLKLETRASIQSFRGQARINESAPESFDFVSEEHGSWTPVRIEVRGNLVRWFEAGELKKEVRTDHVLGGFRFVLEAGGACRVRNLQMKLVNELAPGKTGGSEFSDPDDDEGW